MAVFIDKNNFREFVYDTAKYINDHANFPDWYIKQQKTTTFFILPVIDKKYMKINPAFQTSLDNDMDWTGTRNEIITKYTNIANLSNAVIEMTQGEKDAVDVVEAIILNNQKDFTKQFDKLNKAFSLVVLDEINAIRTNASMSTRTESQLVIAVENKYNTI